MSEIFPVIKAVLSNKAVIITAILVFLYLDFVCYVAQYRKKKKITPVKKKVVAAPVAEPAAEEGGEGSTDGGADDAAGE